MDQTKLNISERLLLFRTSPTSSLITSLTNTFSEQWRLGALDLVKTHGSKKRARSDTQEKTKDIAHDEVTIESVTSSSSSSSSSSFLLRRQFESFFESLFLLLGKKATSKEEEGGKEGRGDKSLKSLKSLSNNLLLDLKVKALDSIVHFMAHANSLKAQRDQGGASLCWPILLQVLTHFLCAGGRGAAISISETETSTPSSLSNSKNDDVTGVQELKSYLISDLSTSLVAFKDGFCDDYDDIRYGVFRGVKELCNVKLALIESSSSSSSSTSFHSTSSQNSGGGILANQILSACDVTIFTRNCADLLLLLSLPSTQSEWDEGVHTSFALEQLDPFLNKEKLEQGQEQEDVDSKSHITHTKSSTHKYFLFNEQLRANGEAWLSLLRLPLPKDVQRRVLLAIPTRVLPYMSERQPLLLADFLTDALKTPSGATPLLALQSLFTLMIRHGLDFPNFYPRLYELLSTDTAHAKYRAKFFQQLDSFLSSPILPAYVAASFAKRLARISLVSPLGVALFAVPAVYNIIRRHPQILPLLHRSQEGNGSGGIQSQSQLQWPASSDPFNAETNDPFATRAIDSSLWELTALQTHYYAPIASLARSLAVSTLPAPITVGVGASLTLPESEGANSPLLARPDFDVSRYLDVTSSAYASLANSELSREVKKAGGKTLADVAFEFRKNEGALFEEATVSVCAWTE
jgi:hypothetical protein